MTKTSEDAKGERGFWLDQNEHLSQGDINYVSRPVTDVE